MNSAVAEHAMKTAHSIDWNNVKICLFAREGTHVAHWIPSLLK